MDRVSVASEATMEVRTSRGAELNMENISVESEAHETGVRTETDMYSSLDWSPLFRVSILSLTSPLVQTKFCVGPARGFTAPSKAIPNSHV